MISASPPCRLAMQIGVGAGGAVEQLAEDHGASFLMSNLANCVGSMDQVSLTFLQGMSSLLESGHRLVRCTCLLSGGVERT